MLYWPYPQTTQIQTKDVVLQRFRNMTYLGTAEAKYYLDESDWHLNNALAEWKLDLSWESSQVKT